MFKQVGMGQVLQHGCQISGCSVGVPWDLLVPCWPPHLAAVPGESELPGGQPAS